MGTAVYKADYHIVYDHVITWRKSNQLQILSSTGRMDWGKRRWGKSVSYSFSQRCLQVKLFLRRAEHNRWKPILSPFIQSTLLTRDIGLYWHCGSLVLYIL